jgi:negative regulator of sigma E activity
MVKYVNASINAEKKSLIDRILNKIESSKYLTDNEIEKAIDSIWHLLYWAKEITEVSDVRKIPISRDGQLIKYLYSDEGMDFYADPYKDYVYILTEAN